jgi:hypothetical protein
MAPIPYNENLRRITPLPYIENLPNAIEKGGGVEGEGGRMKKGWNERLNRMEERNGGQ